MEAPQESHLTQRLGGKVGETPKEVMLTWRSEGLSRLWRSGEK